MFLPKLRYVTPDFKGLCCPYCAVREGDFGPSFERIVRFGFFPRSSDRTRVRRFLCRRCKHTFSQATTHPCFRQKKRHLNAQIFRLSASTVNHRALAKLLRIPPATVEKKIRFLGPQLKRQNAKLVSWFIAQPFGEPFHSLQFDEMESFEHTKCKPLSIPLVVDVKTRIILSINACSMPAKGPLAEKARKKYGFRPNHRVRTLRSVLSEVKPWTVPTPRFRSDSHPYYPRIVRAVYPGSTHQQVESRKSAITGQGELKKVGFDPIFSLNHTAAMHRAHVSRLIRKTWCTTKKVDRLRNHLAIYQYWHNSWRIYRIERQYLRRLKPTYQQAA